MASLAVVPSGSSAQLTRMLTRLSGTSTLLRELDQYYTGTQPLSFLAPEVAKAVRGRLRSLVVNWPRLVVNSLEERLDVDGFRTAKQPDDELWRIWQANDLDEASQMAHVDSLVHGRSFVIVWAGDDPQTPKITVESAEQMTVDFEPGTTNVVAAAKHWAEDDMAYANLFLDDVVLKFSAPMPSSSLVAPRTLNWTQIDTLPHDLGVVPVVPFINKPRLTHPYGESELMDAIPLVDAINKLATDMMVSAEYHAMPRRWATGIDMGDGEGSTERSKEKLRQEWTKAEAGRYNVAEDPNARFGQFQEASLKNFVDGIEMLAAQLAALCGLPPHYVGLMSQANPASADAIRSAEASLVQRVMRKQRVFGGSWERVMRLALLVKNGSVPSSAMAMETIWRDPKTPSVAQMVDAAVKLAQAGMPFRQTLEDTGRTPTEVDRIIEIRQTDTVDEALALAKGVDRLVEETGISRAAALALLGANDAAKYEAIVEARAPGPGVTNDEELAAEVAAATPVAVGPDGAQQPSKAADKAPPAPVA
jgi:hypothetical protein